MPSKALYFLLGMEADDEGFVSPKRVLRIYGGNDDDLKILIAKQFVIPFKSGVVVITGWHDNNYLDKNRRKPTKYQEERKLLTLTEDRQYVFNNGLTDAKQPFNQRSRVERSGEENRREETLSSKEETENGLKKLEAMKKELTNRINLNS